MGHWRLDDGTGAGVADEKRSYLDTPGYTAFLGVVAFWAAASSGNAPYVRVLAGVSAAAAALHLGFVFRRARDRRSTAGR
ncbi:hypothetical protein AB0C94_18510 [Streptomyces griseus]|uniref:hypothetical protein n=1 Tax=Streptomyces griseus TaxID=1911 RepID=UPI0033DCF31E